MNSEMREKPLYKFPVFWGVLGIFVFVAGIGAYFSIPDSKEIQLNVVAAEESKFDLRKQAIERPNVAIVFSDRKVQEDFEKISSQYAECLSASDCVIKGGLWNLYQALQSKVHDLGEETVQYYVINLLNHMMRKMETARDFREAYQKSARKVIEDVNKDQYALSPDWIILADLAYQAGDLKEAKSLYFKTLEMARSTSPENQEQVDVETMSRVRSRCDELHCEISATLDPAESEL